MNLLPFAIRGGAVSLLMTCALAQAPDDKNDPAAELASFKIAEGFEVSLFASEKEGIVKPIAHRFDRFGRLWVIGSTTYPQLKPGEAPNDYVKILEDTNGDGKADKVTTFADGMMIPTGLEIDGDGYGCWVGEGTKLWHMRDTDGDGKADQKEVVLRGFGTGDNHQNINSFRWSPGGELLMSQGLHAFSRVETPWGVTKLDEAGYFRFRPRRQQLDAFWGGPAEPQNPWGFAWDDWGALFVQAGNNGGVFDALPSQFAGGLAKRPASIWQDARGRKCSNPEFVGNAHFPPDWQGLLIAPGYMNHAVWALKFTPDGAGWKVADAPPLITSTFDSFRPMDAKFAPDGSLYIADWYNPIIGHYQASFRHPDRDKQHGRIWRVTAKGRALVKQPEVLRTVLPRADAAQTDPGPSSGEVKELFTLLGNGDRFGREAARRLIATSNRGILNSFVPALLEPFMMRRGNPPPAQTIPRETRERVLYEALSLFADFDRLGIEVIQGCIQASEPRLRAYAAGVVARWCNTDERIEVVLPLLVPLARDPEPRVRLAAVVAAAQVPHVNSLAIINIVRKMPTDKYLDFAIESAVRHLRPQREMQLAELDKAGIPVVGEYADFLRGGGKPAAKAPVGSPQSDPAIAALVAQAKAPPAATHRATPEYVAALAKEVRESGDAKRGEVIYRRAELACVACHRIGNEGGAVGPDLNNLGTAQPLDFIIGAVLEPQREVKEGFEARQVTLKDGSVRIGFRRAAEPAELAIFDSATQREAKFPRDQVAEDKPIGSLMPSGLIDKLTREELRDLFRYLGELGKAK